MDRFVKKSEFDAVISQIQSRIENTQRSVYSRTINFDNSMTITEINARIDAAPKHIPYGQILTLHFADGTYTISSTIIISGFYGGGQILITGNTGEAAALHTTQAVYLDGGVNNVHVFKIFACSVANIDIKWIKFRSKSASGYVSFWVMYNNCQVHIYYSYLLGTSNVDGAAIYIDRSSRLYAGENYVSTILVGISAQRGAEVYSYNNQSTGTNPQYGLMANGAVIRKESTQPAGSVLNEQTYNGGQIL